MSQWYYSKNGQRQGPVSSEQLKQLAATGQLQPSDSVWKEGMSQWAEARKIKGLFQTATVPEPPPPATAAIIPPEPSVQSPQPPADKPEDWYYTKDNQQFGPVTFRTLFELAKSGELGPQDQVAREGAKWQIAEQLLLAFDPQAERPQITDADQWFYLTQGGEVGPLTFQQIEALALNGNLRLNDAVGRVGTNWVAVGAIVEKLPQVAPATAASPNVGTPIDADGVASRLSLIGAVIGLLMSFVLGGFWMMTIGGTLIAYFTSLLLIRRGFLRSMNSSQVLSTVVGIVVAVLFGLSYFGFVGDKWAMSESQMQDFQDNPSHYKGKTLTMNLAFEGQPLSAWVEHGVIPVNLNVQFYYLGRFRVDIQATIPAGMKVPSVSNGAPVRVTFVCKDGELDSGNIIQSLTRR